MDSMSEIFKSVNTLVRGEDSITHEPLYFRTARNHVKKVLIEGVKVAAGIGGFMAISRLMARQNSFASAVGVGAVAVGGSLLLTSRVSVILYDATKITAGLALFKIGCFDFCVLPAVASVKGVAFSMPRMNTLALAVGKGFCRFVAGALSFVGAVQLMTSGEVKNRVVTKFDGDDELRMIEPRRQKHLIDRQITRVVKKAAEIITRMLGYPAPPSDTRNLKAAKSEYPHEEIRPESSSDGSASESE